MGRRLRAQAQNKGSGHLWPVLSAERGEHEIATGNDPRGRRTAAAGMARTASGVGLIPEQVWENADLPASPFGTEPTGVRVDRVRQRQGRRQSPRR